MIYLAIHVEPIFDGVGQELGFYGQSERELYHDGVLLQV